MKEILDGVPRLDPRGKPETAQRGEAEGELRNGSLSFCTDLGTSAESDLSSLDLLERCAQEKQPSPPAVLAGAAVGAARIAEAAAKPRSRDLGDPHPPSAQPKSL